MKIRIKLFWILLFILSRWYIIANPPFTAENGGYSDVQHDYERYANMWRYGLTPYYEHAYEYPPATIPLVYLPLEIDQRGLGFYYLNYRILISIFDLIVFVAIIQSLKLLSATTLSSHLALGFYVISGIIAKDYWYEGIDLVFFGLISLALIWRLKSLHKTMGSKIIFWTLFWLSTSIKFLTAPLLLPFAIPGIKEWKKEAMAIITGFIFVWGLPLIYFRTSLAVMFVVHIQRPLKYGAFGTFVINAINDFTKSEVQTQIAPHFPITGPVSSVVEKLVGITYPMGIALVLIFASLFMLKNQKNWRNSLWIHQSFIRICIIYMMVQFLTAKIFSSPFHIWYVPILAIYPFKNIRDQLFYLGLSWWMIVLDTTTWLKVSQFKIFGIIKLIRIRDFLRFLPMMILIKKTLKLDSLKKSMDA